MSSYVTLATAWAPAWFPTSALILRADPPFRADVRTPCHNYSLRPAKVTDTTELGDAGLTP